jgi:photosystem I P700 chlorophyll a apoprotein A1
VRRFTGIISELQLYPLGGLILAGAMFFAGWFHYHKAAQIRMVPKR